MKNHKKKDMISVDKITPPDEVKPISSKIGNAMDNPSCIYNHERHAAGSVIKNKDGPDSVCTENGDWKHVD